MRIREFLSELANYEPDVEVVIWHEAVVVPIESAYFSDPSKGGDGKVYLMAEQD